MTTFTSWDRLRNLIASLDPVAWRYLDRPLLDCSGADLEFLEGCVDGEKAAALAALDQHEAALAEYGVTR